jgi:hypothetical protein
MKFFLALFISFVLLVFTAARSQTPQAPVTTAASLTDANTLPGGISVPVTVTGFIDISYCKLTLGYQTGTLTYVNAIQNAAFTGMTVTNSVAGSNGTIVISWTGTSNGISLPDLTHLVDLVFTYTSGTSWLSWTTGAANCMYKKYAGGARTICLDTPYSKYYIDGGVSSRGGPITYAPVVSNATPGSISIPVKVKNFTSISSMTLYLEYDPVVLTFISATYNPALGGTYIGTVPGISGKMNVLIGWFNLPAVTLPDGSTLFTLNFSFSNLSGGFSTLNWIEDPANGFICEYADGTGAVLIDSPYNDYYKNGLVYSSTQYSPQTWLPAVTNPIPSGSFSVPVNVSGFTNIKSFTQSFKYDPAVMTYTGCAQNPSLGSVNVTDNAPDANGKKKIVMAWTGASPQSLTDGSALVTLNFTYNSGASSLAWDTHPDSCRFNDANGNAYYDLPKSNYYRNGMVASHPAPLMAAWNATGTAGLPVTIPVLAWHYSNIGTFNFTLDYDPGVLTYQSAALVAPLGGTFIPTNVEPGRLTLAWTGTAVSLPDSSNLVSLTFIYNGGNSPLAWYTAGTSCTSSEGVAQPTLYDLPKPNYYVNGNAGSGPVVANFSASNTTTGVGATVTFSDLSTGSPDTWNWIFSPSTYLYVDSTNSSSRNPHVQFTGSTPVSVTLISSRGMSSNVAVKSNYIQFGTPGFWKGSSSAKWSTASNWDDNTIPGSTTNVMIPASAPNWPVFAGDLNIGTQCKSITMAGSSSLSVTGDFTILEGFSLSCTETATLKIGRNWTNYGIFNSGNGTVIFDGPNDGTIRSGTSPISSLNNYTRSTFPAGMTPLTGGTAGPSGQNTHTVNSIGFPFIYLGVSYTSIRLSSNGWLSLNQSGADASSDHNEYLFTTDPPGTTLAPWWDELFADGSTIVSCLTTGSAPNRVFTVEWRHILSFSSGASARLNFQVVLYETSNLIEFHYGDPETGTHNSAESASIGIEDETGGTGHFIEATTGSMTTGVTTLNSGPNWPAVNFRYTPPPATETFYNLKESKTAAFLHVPGTIMINGNLTLTP